MKFKVNKTAIISSIPFVLAIIIMVPRLVSPQFGLLDDGTMLANVRNILQGDLGMPYDLQAGRFRPVYWLYFTFIYALAGAEPFWFYIGQLVILIILIFEIQSVMKYQKANPWQIFLACLFFLFSVPIIENYYTLSKGEPLQLVFVLGSIISFYKCRSDTNKSSRWQIFVFPTLLLLAGMMVKETSIIMVPIIALWVIQGYLNTKTITNDRKDFLLYLSGSILAVLLFFLIRWLWKAPPVTEGTYTELYSLSWNAIVTGFLRWLTLIAFYFHYLIPFGMLALLLIIKQEKTEEANNHVLMNWTIWVVLWVVVLLPWGFAEAYYLLPFSVGISILIGFLTARIGKLLFNEKKAVKVFAAGLLTLTGLSFLTTLTHYRTHAKTQLLFDDVNYQMLLSTRNNFPYNRAVFVNFETRKEYADGIERLLVQQFDLSDFTFRHLNEENLRRARWISDGIILVPLVENMPRMIPRAGVDNIFTPAWNETVLRIMNERLESIERMDQSFRIYNINLPVLFCPIIGNRGFCTNPDPLWDTRDFKYGWEVYQIK